MSILLLILVGILILQVYYFMIILQLYL